MPVVLKGKKKSPSGFHQAWQARTEREGEKGGGWGVDAGILSSPTTGKEKRRITEGEEAAESIFYLQPGNFTDTR